MANNQVMMSASTGQGIGDLYEAIEKKINNTVFKVLSVEDSVKSKISYGGTSPKEVLKQIKNAKRRFLK